MKSVKTKNDTKKKPGNAQASGKKPSAKTPTSKTATSKNSSAKKPSGKKASAKETLGKKKPSKSLDDVKYAPIVSDEELGDLFTHVLRIPEFFDAHLHRLKAISFNQRQSKFKPLLRCCTALQKKGVTPRDKIFKSELKKALHKFGEKHESWQDDCDWLLTKGSFIEACYKTDPDELNDTIGRSLLKRLLFELEVIQPLRNVLDEYEHHDNMPQDVPDLLESLQQKRAELNSLDSKPIKTIGDEWQEHKARLAKIREQPMRGLKTGLEELDARTGGLRGLIVVAAKPGAGKTTICAVQMGTGVCRYSDQNDCVVVALSLDMERHEIYTRMNSHLAELDWRVLVGGSPLSKRKNGSMFSKAHQKCLDDADERLHEFGLAERLVIVDRTTIGDAFDANRIKSILRETKNRVGAKRALVMLDYLQLWPVPDSVARQGDLAADKYRIREVQKLAEGTQTTDDPIGDTVIVISEARKPPKSKDPWGGSMSELMGAARLGYAADAVILYRDMTDSEFQGYYNTNKDKAENKLRDMIDDGIAPAMLVLEKGRDGMRRGKWAIEFNFRTSTFREIHPKTPTVPGHSTKKNKAPTGTEVPLPKPVNDPFTKLAKAELKKGGKNNAKKTKKASKSES